jgi:hypothetical protein
MPPRSDKEYWKKYHREYLRAWSRTDIGKSSIRKYRLSEKGIKARTEGGLRNRLHKYGLTIDDYKKLYKAQNGKCAICSTSYKRLCVDHSHDTGCVRGLLCKKCNFMVGFAEDNSIKLMLAMAYLEHLKIPFINPYMNRK